MIVYFSKMYQAIPALQELYKKTGGVMITTRLSTFLKVKKNFPDTDIRLTKEYLPNWWPSKKIMHQADVIVTGSPNKEFLSKFQAKKVMTFHGTFAYADKTQWFKFEHFDYLLSIGPRMTEYLSEAGFKNKIIESGYLPFMGFNSLSTKEKSRLYKKLNLAESLRTILYMPRANPFGSWDVLAKRLIEETPKDFNLILRPHPSLAVKMNIGRQYQLREIRKLCKKRGNAVLDLTENSLSSIFNITDLLICDGASSPEDSLFYKIPIIFVETNQTSKAKFAEALKKQNLPDLFIKKRLSIYDCGLSIQLTDSIEAKIKEALNSACEKQKAQESYFNWVFGDRSNKRQKRSVEFLSKLY